jgi:putative transposase
LPQEISLNSTFHWPHAPLHRLSGRGTFIVTGGTLAKVHHFREKWAMDLLQSSLLAGARKYGWQLEAWACFSNHYHFVGHAMEDAESLRPFISQLHSDTARILNASEGREGRQVWYNFWDTRLTYEKSYLARLNYVHQNPVRHKLVPLARHYPWCSAGWFEQTAKPAQVKTIYGFKIDKIKIPDDYDVIAIPFAESTS